MAGVCQKDMSHLNKKVKTLTECCFPSRPASKHKEPFECVCVFCRGASRMVELDPSASSRILLGHPSRNSSPTPSRAAAGIRSHSSFSNTTQTQRGNPKGQTPPVFAPVGHQSMSFSIARGFQPHAREGLHRGFGCLVVGFVVLGKGDPSESRAPGGPLNMTRPFENVCLCGFSGCAFGWLRGKPKRKTTIASQCFKHELKKALSRDIARYGVWRYGC